MKPVMKQNKFLSQLSEEVLTTLDPFMEIVQIRKGTASDYSSLSYQQLYLPLTCVFSVDVRMMDGFDAHLALLGCQHAVVMQKESEFNLPGSAPRPIIGGYALQLDMEVLAKDPQCAREVSLGLRRQSQSMVSLVAVTTGCNLRHSLPRRLARWLLSLSLTATATHFELTHEEIALLLGVRREAVTEAVSHLSRAGAVSTSRGRMIIIDVPLLQRYACDCFKLMYPKGLLQLQDRQTLQAAIA